MFWFRVTITNRTVTFIGVRGFQTMSLDLLSPYISCWYGGIHQGSDASEISAVLLLISCKRSWPFTLSWHRAKMLAKSSWLHLFGFKFWGENGEKWWMKPATSWFYIYCIVLCCLPKLRYWQNGPQQCIPIRQVSKGDIYSLRFVSKDVPHILPPKNIEWMQPCNTSLWQCCLLKMVGETTIFGLKRPKSSLQFLELDTNYWLPFFPRITGSPVFTHFPYSLHPVPLFFWIPMSKHHGNLPNPHYFVDVDGVNGIHVSPKNRWIFQSFPTPPSLSVLGSSGLVSNVQSLSFCRHGIRNGGEPGFKLGGTGYLGRLSTASGGVDAHGMDNFLHFTRIAEEYKYIRCIVDSRDLYIIYFCCNT